MQRRTQWARCWNAMYAMEDKGGSCVAAPAFVFRYFLLPVCYLLHLEGIQLIEALLGLFLAGAFVGLVDGGGLGLLLAVGILDLSGG